jgi:hypothetical protein
MPVLVIGADTELGHAIVPALQPASGEIRVFASDADAVADYRSFAKVAVGDVSDGTHVGGAAIGAFCAIVIAAAAHDERERHFADSTEELFAQWADGLRDAGISRVIVVGNRDGLPDRVHLDAIGAEYSMIDTTDLAMADIVASVAAAESAARL